MKATVINLRFHAPNVAGAPVSDPANGERDGPGERRISARPGISAQPRDDDWQDVGLKSFQVTLHPGLRLPPLASAPKVTWRVVAREAGRPVFWACSMITAGLRTVARRWRENRMVAKLERLDDVTLKDLGICRCEIEYLARTQASGKWRA
jgi:uncharacterized protein YjiS (DUF1127 family)